ncbi:MAG: hypothetical protein QM796_01655 [Chthoniobacteraceae bacterium]
MLWDVGFKVGHSTRSISTAIKQANDDMQSKTSLLEARFLVGDEQLFEDFTTEFVNRCLKGHEAAYIKERVNNQAERHQKFGGTVYMQEPNIKNGCGSLRDYQNLLWVGNFKDRARTMAELGREKAPVRFRAAQAGCRLRLSPAGAHRVALPEQAAHRRAHAGLPVQGRQ